MKEIEDLMADWKKVTKNTLSEESALITNQNKTIMNTIINYENQEKEDKRRSKVTALFAAFVFLLAIVPQVLLGNMILRTPNYIGFVTLCSLIILSIILNRTDNFPDARTLSVREYLKQVKDTIF